MVTFGGFAGTAGLALRPGAAIIAASSSRLRSGLGGPLAVSGGDGILISGGSAPFLVCLAITSRRCC